jgi:LuxR family transcriptional regulator, maltose regulon positive regulatory protein
MARRGVGQMRADAGEAVRGFPIGSAEASAALLFQGIPRTLCGDLEGGDASLEDALRVAKEADVPEDISDVPCERSLLAMARGDWTQAEALAGQAGTVLRQAKIEDVYAAALPCAIQARTACHRGDISAARQQLLHAQRLRPLLT